MGSIQDIRKDYTKDQLDEQNCKSNAMDQFKLWFDQALNADIHEPNAMVLSTLKQDGFPSARVVLIKGIQDHGFEFFTNYESNKGKELENNPKANLLFFWPELERQVRIQGIVEKLPYERSDEYFNSRPIGSQLGAWTSPQSQVIASRTVLEDQLAETKKRFESQKIERPEFWGGYIVKPLSIEFWQGRASRLHDRLLYSLQEDKSWKIERLAP